LSRNPQACAHNYIYLILPTSSFPPQWLSPFPLLSFSGGMSVIAVRFRIFSKERARHQRMIEEGKEITIEGEKEEVGENEINIGCVHMPEDS